ncbi:MAG TPA: sensor histidine kinase, partial [Chitinophagaceae bacterium]|nr:sensor histidine kinase [Chitinophagaceae bacterium]
MYLRTMLSTKNISPRQLSFFTALILSVPVSLLIGAVEKDWRWGLGTFVVILGGSYYLISFMLE